MKFRVCSRANQSLKQFVEVQKLMKQFGSLSKAGKLPRVPGMPRRP